jgi:hypothetical protein
LVRTSLDSWERWPWLLLEAGALFAAATFIFDTIHFGLHRCLKSRRAWVRGLASPHQAHHDLCDRHLIYHEDVILRNLVLHVIPEYATQMAVCAMSLLLLEPLAVFAVMAGFTLVFLAVVMFRGTRAPSVPMFGPPLRSISTTTCSIVTSCRRPSHLAWARA